jgi:hypothetical protein
MEIFMEVKNFSFPANMVKSGEEVEGRIPIKIIPSAPTFDRQNDKILLRAFDEDCIKGFLFDGILDYDHKSMLGKTDLEKAQAHIGEPEKLYVDKEKGLPVCEGFLFKGNPYVDNVILPALNSKSKVFGASLGGKIMKKSSVVDKISKKEKNVISKISLKHIAITPLQKAVHQGTTVQLKKSGSDDFEFSFSNFDTFLKSFESPEGLSKALEAGNATDSVGMSGGQVLQNQSLEGDGKDRKKKKKKIDKIKLKSAMPFIIDAVANRLIKGGYNDFKKYFMQRGFNNDEAEETTKLIAKKRAEIVKLIF